jgi:hypothetical protein
MSNTANNKNRKARIVHSEYAEANDLIKWHVIFYDDNTEQTYVWPSCDLLNALNIKGKVDSAILHKFCRDMNNKDINLVVDVNTELPTNEMNKQDYDTINKKVIKEFDNFKNSILGDRHG